MQCDQLFLCSRGVSVIWETLTWRRETWDVPAAVCSNPALEGVHSIGL